jgi:glyoxylase-like metal-dependent hydrolase (beta-lactamase superfamily II)
MLCGGHDGGNVGIMTVVANTYTGHVESQTATRRTLPGVTIIKMSVGPMDNNAYVVTCSATGESLLIDAANDPELLVALLAEHAPKLEMIVTTHQHYDHWQALEAVAEATGAPTAVHQLDAEALPVSPDRFLAGGDTIVIGELDFDVIHLRGHTPGSVALALRPAGDRTAVQLFTGDCLFPGGLGRTTKPEEFDSLFHDVSSQVFGVYGDDTVVYPGHGDDTTLGEERPHLQEWRERGW